MEQDKKAKLFKTILNALKIKYSHKEGHRAIHYGSEKQFNINLQLPVSDTIKEILISLKIKSIKKTDTYFIYYHKDTYKIFNNMYMEFPPYSQEEVQYMLNGCSESPELLEKIIQAHGKNNG